MADEALRRYADDIGPGRDRPLNTDDHPVIELVAPRRNVRPRAEIARLAQAQYEAFVGAAGSGEPPLLGLPAAEAPRFATALGERYAEAGQPARAIASLERALAQDPSLDRALERLSHLYLDRRDFPRAETAHRELLRLRPRDVRPGSAWAPPSPGSRSGRRRATPSDGPARWTRKRPWTPPSSTTSSARPAGGGGRRRAGPRAQARPAGISAPPPLYPGRRGGRP